MSTTAEDLKLFSSALGGCSREISLDHVIQCSVAFSASVDLGPEKVSNSSQQLPSFHRSYFMKKNSPIKSILSRRNLLLLIFHGEK